MSNKVALRPGGIHHSTWTMIVIVSDANEAGEFYVELEDPRYSGPAKVIARETFKVGESFAGWITKASRAYLNKRGKELHKS